MPRSTPDIRPREYLHESRRTDRPLFFDQNEGEWDLSHHLEIPLTTALPNVSVVQGMTHRTLRHLFKSRIRDNEAGLSLAYVNRHDVPHMDRVANGTYHMGTYLGYSQVDVRAATLAARFHDVGYEFPENADPSELEVLGKELHANHAAAGAELVTEALMELHTNPGIRAELQGWTDETFQIAHESIRLHSNDVGTDEESHPVTLLPRFIDKLDNSSERVRPGHIEDFRLGLGRSIQHIQHKVRSRSRHTLSDESLTARSSRYKMDIQEARQHMAAVDPYYFHRIAPLAISSQRLFLNPQEVSAIVEYHAYPSVVSDALKVPYTKEDHAHDFLLAYDKSMLNAARVMHLLRENQPTSNNPDAMLLTVRIMYEDGKQRTINYGPEIFVPAKMAAQTKGKE